jgi:hypothetical protein
VNQQRARLPPEVAKNIEGQPWADDVRRAFRDETEQEKREREVGAAEKREAEVKHLEHIAARVQRGEYGHDAQQKADAVIRENGVNYYSLQTIRNLARKAKAREKFHHRRSKKR